MSFASDIVPILTDVMTEMQKRIRQSAAAQGHRLTGNLEDSIEFEIIEGEAQATGRMFVADYGVYVEFGVKADKIPYSGRTGAGGTSKYIQGLISFWQLRGLSGREAVSAAFATAAVHKREGMPTRASYAFSSTGDRLGFIRTAIEDSTDDIGKIIEARYGAKVLLNFAENFSQYENIVYKK